MAEKGAVSVMTPQQGCWYLGAYRAAIGVSDAFLLVHSVTGCAWGALSFHQCGRQGDIRQGCTMVHEREVVYGGERKLAEALALLKPHPLSLAFVLTGCPTGMIHDDVAAVIEQAHCPFPVYALDSAGYRGSARQGYLATLVQLAGLADPEARPADGPSVNLIGLSLDDYKSASDVEAIRRMLEPCIRLNAVLPYLDSTQLSRLGEAHLNLVLRGFEAVGEALQRRLGTPYLTVDYPYGLAGSTRFMKAASEALGVDCRETISRGEALVEKAARSSYHALRTLYQAYAAVCGDYPRAHAMRDYLTQELGMIVPAYQDDREPHADIRVWERAALDVPTVLVLGSSFNRNLEDQMPARLVRFAAPVFDAVSLGYRPYAGYEGAPNLLEDLINGILTMPYRREGNFEP